MLFRSISDLASVHWEIVNAVMNNDSKYLLPPLRGSDEKMDPLSVYCTNTASQYLSQAKRAWLPLIHMFVCA